MVDMKKARKAPESAEIISVSDSGAAAYYFALCILIIARLWIVPLRNGFWLDETGTVWAIRGQLRDVMTRCDIWPSQSPAYSFLAWFFFRLPGPHEVMLRLPSLIAMCGAAYFLYRLALRLLGPRAAWPTVIIFASIEPVAFAAADARPYAIAMLAVVAAIFFLVRWFDMGRPLDGLGYCLLASLSVYMHFVFAAAFLIHLTYGIFRLRTERRITPGQLCVAASTIVLLLLPATFHLIAVLKTGHSFSFAGAASANDLFTMLAPPVFVAGILWLFFLSRLTKQPLEFRLPDLSISAGVLIVSWVLLPVVLLAGFSTMTSLKLFLPRYTLPSEAGLALLGGWLIGGITPVWTRRIAVTVLVLSVLATAPSAKYSHGGDWRAAMAATNNLVAGNSQMPILIRSGFVESDPFNWLDDQTRSAYLFAPLLVYSPTGGKLVRLPFQLNLTSIAYLNTLALDRIDRFVFVNMGDSSYENWLLGRLSSAGFDRKRIGSFGGSLTVEEYYRTNQTSSNVR